MIMIIVIIITTAAVGAAAVAVVVVIIVILQTFNSHFQILGQKGSKVLFSRDWLVIQNCSRCNTV
jgi:hypothetical protein